MGEDVLVDEEGGAGGAIDWVCWGEGYLYKGFRQHC